MWNAVSFEVDGSVAESLSNILLAFGAEFIDVADSRAGLKSEKPIFCEPKTPEEAAWEMITLTATFNSTTDVHTLLNLAFSVAGITIFPQYAVRYFDDQDWVTKSRAQFLPIQISERLWVVPSWHQIPDRAAINVILDPGRAFGTGEHPTTRLCLLWLDKHISGGEIVLDYGCGSGILGIAAVKLGAAKVYGIDIDQDALEVAQINAMQNSVEIEFSLGNETPDRKVDVIVANILAKPLKTLAPLFAGYAKVGAKIVLSGLLEGQEKEIRETYASWVQFDDVLRRDGWICLIGTRRA